MSFYSSLTLAANSGVKNFAADKVRVIFDKCELLNQTRGELEIGNLAVDITGLFDDPDAIRENPHFFCPDTISIGESVEISAIDGEYACVGWCVTIHGNGYFFPWNVATIRERVIQTSKLQNLQRLIETQFGGQFSFPESERHFLTDRRVHGRDGWVWFISESM